MVGAAGAIATFIVGWGVTSRVVASLAMVVGLVVTGGMGGLAALTAREYADPPPPAASDPTCGPDSHPPFYGEDSLWSPCPDAIAAAQQFADMVLPALPTTDVTVDSVESVVTDPDLLDGQSAQTYVGSRVGPNGSVSVAWVAAPVTCAIYAWDGTAWMLDIAGTLIEGGGCLYDGR